jgi:hypothetical protein
MVLWGVLFLFGVYAFWLVFRAKTFQPLTLDELALTWRLHKSEVNCKASAIRDVLVRNDKVVGFRCGCGYEFLQKRLMSQKVQCRAQDNEPLSIKGEGLLQKPTGSALSEGIRYSNIERV